IEPVLKPKSEADLANLTVMTEQGPKPVSSVAKWVKAEKSTKFFRKDGKSYVRISADVEPSRLSIVGGEIQKVADSVAFPEGVKLFVGGASADQAGDLSSLFSMALVSIGVVFLLMVITFKAFRASIAILSSLLFVPIGSVLGLIASG